MNKNWLALGVAALLPLVIGGPASAPRRYTMAQRCVIANEDCFIMRASAGGMPAEQRLDRVNERLAYILGYENLRPGNIRMVAMPGGTQQIRVGRSLLVTVTRADARANGARNPRTLARVWLRNLKDAMPQARPMANIASTASPTTVA